MGEESQKFDADMNMNLTNVHIVPNVRDKPLKESPSNSPTNSDDEGEVGYGQDSSPWDSGYNDGGDPSQLVPNRLAIKEMCRSVKAEQRKLEKHQKRKSVSLERGVLTTN